MKLQRALQICCFIVLGGISPLYSFAGEEPVLSSQPNVILIIADDLGIQLGCYGDPQALTPNIDQLASTGTRFETAWVTAASCSPSRGSIHTGRYPHQTGLVGLAHHGFSMDDHYPTIASELKARGYRTGVIGKYHIAPHDLCPWDYQLTQEVNRDLVANNRDVVAMSEIAEGFVAGNSGPFFLVMSYIDPHVPLFDQRLGLPEDPVSSEQTEVFPFSGYSSAALKQRTASYLNCINRLDTGIGLFMDMLEDNEVMDNTLIIFIGDHGPPFPRAKMSSYDLGLRIPFIVSGPNLQSEALSQQPVSTVDILPTILDYVGAPVIDDLPGQSLLGILEGEAVADVERPLFSSYTAHQADATFPMRVMRLEDLVFIENLSSNAVRPRPETDGAPLWPGDSGYPLEGVDTDTVYQTYRQPPRYELYNLATDPNCFENLAYRGDFKDRVADLNSQLQLWRKQTNDPTLKP
ncbi:sulfatase [Coraliomargarita sp. SDUM461004]|uniref:Sulfatase n=1 Tax=Thalassobacterium sedimentorum TaxID=3041258 RepID=A0ABU1AJU5_9BACT|nr:sulfatase [Coraliomargarita sp. SDUM461004]MDQ8194110.1 sulfatase [Coraliomargarita sp. SDUM461004]